jgi:hypothetical protein
MYIEVVLTNESFNLLLTFDPEIRPWPFANGTWIILCDTPLHYRKHLTWVILKSLYACGIYDWRTRVCADLQVWPWPLSDGPGICVRHDQSGHVPIFVFCKIVYVYESMWVVEVQSNYLLNTPCTTVTFLHV